jgi:two-component system, OmpR family, copper resistance phosphate regulon response regulator CusR
MSSILVAEDEERIASFIHKGLRASGFTVTVVSDGPSAVEHAMTGEYDLLLLDLGLPLLDGFAVLGRLRQAGSRLPVIILTARAGLDDTLAGLKGGADDYLAKPFHFEELVARIRLRLRNESRELDPMVLRYGDLALDRASHQVAVSGREVTLSSREYALLETLMRHPGQVLAREQLLSRVWGYDFDPGSNVVDVYIRYLRRKVGADRIETVRGVGYRLREKQVQP